MHHLEPGRPRSRSLFGGYTSAPAPLVQRQGQGMGDLPGALAKRSPALSALEFLELLLGAEWTAAAEFSGEGYVRTCIYEDALREIYVMGWLPGQLSVIHDHGGAACAYGVIRGCMTERTYRLCTPVAADESLLQRVDLLEVHRWQPGSRIARLGDDIHCCGNASGAQEPLVTLHVYARPQRPERTYVAR